MCSTCDCDANNTNQALTNDSRSAETRGCRRCGSEPFIILDKVHVECKSCFLETCNKKLRSTIGKSKLLRNNDPILIAHSGGASSMALTDLIKNSIEFNFRREQKFRPSILHVDTQSIDNPEQDPMQRTESLSALLEDINNNYPHWPLYWTTIEMIAREHDCDNVKFYAKYDSKPAATRPELFDSRALCSLKTTLINLDPTDKQHYLRKSISYLIVQVAEDINKYVNSQDALRCIFTASSATQLANNLLVDVILGEGATCRSTVSICDDRLAVPIIRPLKELSKKEIAFYLMARQLQINTQTNLATLTDCKASIQRLTESFLSKLSVDYPSTYSTLLRTGDKLQDS